MNLRAIAATAVLAALISGCQSTPWKTAANSRFGLGKLRSRQTKERAEDVELVSGDNLRNSRRNRSDDSAGSDDPTGTQSDSKTRQILARGHKAEADGQLQEAKQIYREVLESDPRNALAHHRLAILADKQGEFDKAEGHYLTALAINRDDPNLLSDLGYSFLLQNRIEQSKYYLDQAIEKDPSHRRALNNLGLLNARQGDYDGALALFRRTGNEQDAQAKMQELFPGGRPPGAESLAAGERAPQLPEVMPASGSADWGDRAPQDSRQIAAAPAIPNQFASNPGNVATAGINTPAAAQGRTAPPFPSDQNQQIAQQRDPRHIPANPLDALEEWPPRGSLPAPSENRAVPFPADPNRPAGNAPDSNNSQPTDQFPGNRGTVRTAVTAAPNSTPFGNNDANGGAHQLHQNRQGAPVDPRQQAAMIGLNAGPGGVFPMTHDPRTAAQPQQPTGPPAIQPRNVDPQFHDQSMPQHGRPNGHYEAAAQPSSNDASRGQRTAARPVTQSVPNIQPTHQHGSVGYQHRPTNQPAAAQSYQPVQQQQYQQPQYQQPQQSYRQYAPAPMQQQAGPNSQGDPRVQQQPYRPHDNRYSPQTNGANPNGTFQPGNTYPQGSTGR